MFFQREPSQFENTCKFNKNNQSQKIDNQLSKVPSFENLQARLRDYSYSRFSNIINNQTIEPKYSPHKAQGLQSKINATLGPKNKSSNWRESFQSSSNITQSPSKYSQQSSGQIKYSIEIQSNKKSLEQSYRCDSYRTQSEYYQKKSNHNLSDVVQLNEIVALRNKIESSSVNRSLLTSTYISELIKLAQAITTSLKNQ